jgi:hypothetical protein
MSNIKDRLIAAYKEAYKNESWFDPNEEFTDGELIDILTEADTVFSKKVSGSRWWDNTQEVVRIGDKYFEYMGATTTGDMSAWEAGWEFDWSTVVEVEPYQETITITKYRRK